VTVLTVVMIAGVITITALLVIRLNGGAPPVTIAPGDFEIPAGVGVLGISVIDGLTVIVGDDGVIRVYDSESRAMLQEITLDRVRGRWYQRPGSNGGPPDPQSGALTN
jgi:uncharacterized integral membrane protein